MFRIGTPNVDFLDGSAGNDLLDGRESGGAGGDFVNAAIGNDVLNCGTGVDEPWAGAGQDRLVQADRGAANADRLLDFSHADHSNVLADRPDGGLKPGIPGLRFGADGRLAAASDDEGAVGSASGIYVTSAGRICYTPTLLIAGDTALTAMVDPGALAPLDQTVVVCGAVVSS